MSDLRVYPRHECRLLPSLAGLLLICAFGLLAGCTSPQVHHGFEPAIYATTPGSKLKVLLRVPPGAGLNGTATLILTEGLQEDENATVNSFELKQTGNPATVRSGSIIMPFELTPRDYTRYDRTTKRIVKRLSEEDPVRLIARYRLCRRAGVTVSPPYVVGFLMTNENTLPFYLAEIALPAEIAKEQLPFCI